MNIDPSEIRTMVRIATQKTGAPLHDEDLEQEAALKVMEAFRKQFVVRHPRAFLKKVVSDAVRDHWRRRRTIEDIDTVDEKHLAHAPRPEDDMDRIRRIELLRTALAQLDAAKRRTVDLFYVEDCPIGEIARIQNKSTSAIKMELLRARRLLAAIVVELAKKKSR